MDVIKNIRNFLNIWYIRYLTATEMYMVEPWEKILMHIVFGSIFVFFWYFNYSIIVNGISQLRDSSQQVEVL